MARLRRGQDRRSLFSLPSELTEEAVAADASAVATGASSGRGFFTGTWSELFPGWLINAALGWAAAEVGHLWRYYLLCKPNIILSREQVLGGNDC